MNTIFFINRIISSSLKMKEKKHYFYIAPIPYKIFIYLLQKSIDTLHILDYTKSTS